MKNFKKVVFDKILSYQMWRHRIPLGKGFFTQGYNNMPNDWEFYHFPKEIRGKTFLDVGANDGFFSFEAEKRGAALVRAIDIYHGDSSNNKDGWNRTGIDLAKAYLSSTIEIEDLSIYQLSSLNYKWDMVLCSDVLSWIEDTKLGLRNIIEACSETLIIKDTFLLSPTDKPLLEYCGAVNQLEHRMNLKYLEVILEMHGFTIQEVYRIPVNTQYVWQDNELPSAWSELAVPVYKNCQPHEKINEKILNGEWVLAEYNDFSYIRNLGWVNKKLVDIHLRHSASQLKKFLKEITPLPIINMYKQWNHPHENHQEITVIAKRIS